MPKDKPDPKPTLDTLQAKVRQLEREKRNLAKVNQDQAEELATARRQLGEVKTDMEAELHSQYLDAIQAILKCSDAELTEITANKTLKELEAMVDTLQIKEDAKSGAFVSVRSGASKSSLATKTFTVGDLFGKSRKEILQMNEEG